MAKIERDESYQRDYIPLPGGWEVQTKGRGSSFRIAETKGDGFRLNIPDSPYLFDLLERMAREVFAAHDAVERELEETKKQLDAWKQGVMKFCCANDWIPDKVDEILAANAGNQR